MTHRKEEKRRSVDKLAEIVTDCEIYESKKVIQQLQAEIDSKNNRIAEFEKLTQWKPIETLPLNNHNKIIIAFANYSDEPKGIEIRLVGEVIGFNQYTHWMEAMPLPIDYGDKWCSCADCQRLKQSWIKLSPPLPTINQDE